MEYDKVYEYEQKVWELIALYKDLKYEEKAKEGEEEDSLDGDGVDDMVNELRDIINKNEGNI